MPTANDDVTVLVCDCGKRLKAPGARPGRVGQCPACGAVLRYPGDSEPPTEHVRETPRDRPVPAKVAKPKRSTSAIPVGASAASDSGPDESVNPERARRIEPERREELRDANRQVGRGGILRVPRRTAVGLKDALLYPIWDFAGVSWMMFLPVGLGLPFLGTFYLIPEVARGGTNMLFLPFATPMPVILGFGLGYLGQVWTAVFLDSAVGEVHHPRWPEISFGAFIASLFRWACGMAIGLGLGALLAVQYWRRVEDHSLGDRLAATALVASGLSYGLMSLASLVLHGDLLALNPLMVVNGILKAGWRYWQTVMLAVVFALVGTLGVEMVDRASGFLFLPATFLLWLFIVYAGLVVCRSLGMVCHARAKQIGWFPDRPRWGASTGDVDPSIFRDKEGRRAS